MTDLGDLPGGGDFSYAQGINNAGQVVVFSGAATGGAFLWQNGVMTDLNTVSGVAGTGWSLTDATAINDAGQIVGYGSNPQGVTSAFILTPVPEPEAYLMMGVGVCLAGVIARRRKQIG
jgi:probable HAF family extracellular repeat protein